MNTSDLQVIQLGDNPRERGRFYGEKTKSLIANIVDLWRAELGNFGRNSEMTNNINSDAYLSEFFSQTGYLCSIEKWTPDLLEEVKGIAEGSGQSLEHILGLQLLDEEWVFGLRRQLPRPRNKCTAFGIPAQLNETSYAGQNMDVGSWVDGGQVLLRVMPTNGYPEALVFSVASNIGLNGVNSHGLGVTCNTLAQLNYSTDGLPVAFIVRTILQKKSIDEAEEFLRAVPHASGQNYILSSSGDMRCFECCGSSVVRYAPEEYQGRVFHSNHPLVNEDICFDVLPPELMRSNNSVARFDSICSRLGDTSQTLTLDDIKAALSAHDDPANPVSRNTNNENSPIGFTAGSSIYELGDVPRLHLAAGPPCETDYEVFEFSTL